MIGLCNSSTLLLDFQVSLFFDTKRRDDAILRKTLKIVMAGILLPPGLSSDLVGTGHA